MMEQSTGSTATSQALGQSLALQFQQIMANPAKTGSGPVAADPVTVALFQLAERAARGKATILITGPSGAGKEVMARYLHDASPRRKAPFLAINCAALPEAMLEALLFGHEKGAFTGAQGQNQGLFRAADGGSLFLDEIGELPLALQSKLLRAVEQGEVLPLGATSPVKVDVRLIAATNRDLAAEVEAQRFRADLYWRLCVFPLRLPPLCERRGDILPLTATIFHRMGLSPRMSNRALEMLLRHDWPGNVRELSNVLERAAILSNGTIIDTDHILIDITPPPILVARPALQALPQAEYAQPDTKLADNLRAAEALTLEAALAETGGRKAEAARRLGISERTLRYKLAAMAGRPRTPARAAQPMMAALA